MTVEEKDEEQLFEDSKETCSDCKSVLTERGTKGETRLIRFVGVTSQVSNKHRFPVEIMRQMVQEAKERFVLPIHPKSITEIDTKQLQLLEQAGKSIGFGTKEPIPIRDTHHTDRQATKIGRVLSIETLPFYKGEKKLYYHDVVGEVFDPHAIKLLDRGMASKYSIGFKHRFHLENGVKVSDYSVLDHYGVVDSPADGDANLLEVKSKKLAKGRKDDCVAAKVSEGLSQEEAAQKCQSESQAAMEAQKMEGKAEDPFTPAGDPETGGSDANDDCVAGLVAEGISQEAAKAACHGSEADRESTGPEPTTPTVKPSSGFQMVDKELHEETKALRSLIEEQKAALTQLATSHKALLMEKKQLEVKREVERLMLEGRVLPSKKEKVFNLAMAFEGKEDRETYYDTLEPILDYSESAQVAQGGEAGFKEAELDAAAKELWGSDMKSVLVNSNKGGRN